MMGERNRFDCIGEQLGDQVQSDLLVMESLIRTCDPNKIVKFV